MRTTKLHNSIFITSLGSLLALIFLVILALLKTTPPKPVGLDAALDEFSALRAFKHIGTISQRPHMVGTLEKEEVCNYIVNQLEEIGLAVDIQTTTVAEDYGFPVFANITNIVGRIKGEGNTKAIMVVGHYDTQPHTPGAADDGIAVGSMLEAANVIFKNYKLQNDIIFLFTDAEEVGLLGAEAFAKEHRWMEEVGLVLNLEARGNKGAVLAFEVSSENGWIIKEFVKGVERPFAGSMMYEVYNMLPNNTDFTVFKEKGVSGFNLAIVDGFVNYHSATDTPENLDLGSLQHMGSYIMSIAKHFGNIPLNETKAKDLVYFNYFGHRMLYFPASLNLWILVFIVILFIGFLVLGLVRNQISIDRIIFSFLFLIILLGMSIGAVWGLNALIIKLYPHYSVYYMSNFYNVGFYFLSYTLVPILFFSLLIPLFTRYINIYNVIASVFILFILLSGFILWKLPTASYLTFLPLLFGLISFNMLLFLDIDKIKKPWAYHLILLLGVVPLVFMISPYIHLIFVIFGLNMPYAGAGMISILLLFSLPVFEDVLWRTRKVLPVILFLAVLVFLSLAHSNSSPTKERPLQSNVLYASLNDEGKAYWFSRNLITDEWNSQFFKDAVIANASDIYPWRKSSQLKANAEYKEFDKPEIEMVYDSIKTDTRVIEFNLKSKVNPVISEIFFPLESGLTHFSVNGKSVQIIDNQYSKRIGYFFFRIYSPNYGGDRIKLEFAKTDSVSFRMVEVIHGLPNFKYIKPMPSHIIPHTGYESLVTVVANTLTIE